VISQTRYEEVIIIIVHIKCLSLITVRKLLGAIFRFKEIRAVFGESLEFPISIKWAKVLNLT
jgi:hypothetical protein